MNKCPNCGQDYKVKFCPNCGKNLQEKTCPKCGTESYSSAKFCSECGYSFSAEDGNSKEKESPKNWLKKRRGTIIAIAVVFVVIAAFIAVILICNIKNNDGTYYKVKSNGELDKTTYFVLKSGNWEDEDGETGTFKIDGDKIVFYYSFFGETEELCDGTLKDGVLKINGDTYATEKANVSKASGKSLTVLIVQSQMQQ